MSFFLRSVLVGLSIAAPVGPVGVLCMQRSLGHGRLTGFISGLGAATADAIYASLAAFGLTIVSRFLVEQQALIRLFGGLFLCFLALRSFVARTVERPADVRLSSGTGLLRAYASAFLLTLTNPMTILLFIGIFAAIGLGDGQSAPGTSVALVAGVFLGSMIWWFALTTAAGLLRRRLGPLALRWVNWASGAILGAFGLAALLSLV